MRKLILLFCSLASLGIAQTRYIAPTGTNNGDCTDMINPCGTINYAVSQAVIGDTIVLMPGNYLFSETQVVDKSVCIMPSDLAMPHVVSTSTSTLIEVSAPHVEINGLNFTLGLTANTGLRCIVANNNYDSLKIRSNNILSTKPFSFGMVFESYAIALNNALVGYHAEITDNTISVIDVNRDAFGRGIGLGGSNDFGTGGLIEGNTVLAFYPIQLTTNQSNLTISNNTFTGNTLIGYCRNGTEVNITGNTFDGLNAAAAQNIAALLEIRACDNAIVNVNGNDFLNYANVGLLSSASKNVFVNGNVFSPLNTADAFISLLVNTKLLTTGIQINNYPNAISIKGNEFNAGAENQGVAIQFANHKGLSEPIIDSLTIGGEDESEFNVFDTGIEYYVFLDTLNGPSNSQQFYQGFENTTMVPFAKHVNAYMSFNDYGITDIGELELKMFDSLDVSGLGKVILEYTLPVSINSNEKQKITAVFPNPANDFVTVINSFYSENTLFEMFDMQGRMIFFTNIGSNPVNNIDIRHIPTGIYTIKVSDSKQVINYKLIKN